MAGIRDAIKKEAAEKHIPIQDARSRKIYNLLNELFWCPPEPTLEIEFEKQLFTRGTGEERSGLHTSAIIASENNYCCREQVLSLLYMPKKSGATHGLPTLRIFEEGNYVHRKWQRLLLRGKLAKVEDLDKTQFNKRYQLSFSPDAIIDIKGRKFIVEIKSMNEFAYKKTLRHLSGEKQCRMYMFLSGIPNGIVLMENKNNQDFQITILKEEQSEIQEYMERLEEIKDYYETKRMPDRLPKCKTKLTKRCLDCPMGDACWATPAERKAMRIGYKPKAT